MISLYDPQRYYSVEEAIAILKKSPQVKFDQSIDLSLKLGVDPRKPDQHVRGTVSLPNGTGKELRILVLAQGSKIQEAQEAGADYVGNQELIEKISNGWTDFDAVIATPDMMREVGKLGKVLGPRGLMPTPKAGTVTTDVAQAIAELKAGKIEFKVDKHGVINSAIGKLSFELNQIVENFKHFVQAIQKAKPVTAKGDYLRSLVISSTMGVGIKIDLKEIEAA
ncbi:MAG: 50S ribosomal protein L1 [Chlamydiales bacterium]